MKKLVLSPAMAKALKDINTLKGSENFTIGELKENGLSVNPSTLTALEKRELVEIGESVIYNKRVVRTYKLTEKVKDLLKTE